MDHNYTRIERFLDVDKETTKELTAIEGYEINELMTLEEAVRPLEGLIHNLEAMVQIAMDNSCNPKDELTQDESAAIYLYTMQWPEKYPSLYLLLNQVLRSQDQKSLVPWHPYLKLYITALNKLPAYKGVIWRGIQGDLSNTYNGEQIWLGVSSCTQQREVVENYLDTDDERTLFEIECINGKDIRNHSYFETENEILLMPGTSLQIVDKHSPSKDLHIIHLRESPAPYVTLLSTLEISSTIQEQPIQEPEKEILADIVSTASNVSNATYENQTLEQKLKNKKNLKKLDLSSMDLTDQDMEIVVFHVLQNNKTLKELNFSCNQIEAVGVKYLADAITDNTTLTVLDLSENQIGDQGAQYLAAAILNNTTLTKLYLSENQIGEQGMQHLANAITNNTTLTTLDLGTNQIGKEGTQHLVDAITKNTTLTALYLSENQIGDEGTRYLADAITNETVTLTVLDLTDNCISDQGVQYLATSITNNTTLKELHLSGNQIGEQGAQYLADAIKSNTTLEELYLYNNEIGDKGAEHFANAIINNKTLKQLYLVNNQIGDEAKQRVMDILRENKTVNVNL